MAVGPQPALKRATILPGEFCQWKGGQDAHYEAWFVTLSDSAAQRGFRFRYALEVAGDQSPQGEARDLKANSASEVLPATLFQPRVELWASAFDRSRPERNIGLRREYDIGRFESKADEGPTLLLGDGLLSGCRATGSILNRDHRIQWDLRFGPGPSGLNHFDRTVGVLAWPSASVCSPTPDTRFNGMIVIDDREFSVSDAPGCQSHLSARKLVDEWVWVQTNKFEEHKGTVFQGLATWSRRAGRAMLPVQSLCLRHRGDEHHFVRLRLHEPWRRNLGIGYWAFSAMNARVYIEGTVHCRLRDMLQAEYVDPYGAPRYFINCEVANLKIRLFRRAHGLRWRHEETIKARATAHLEHGARTSEPGVPRSFPRLAEAHGG